MVTHRIGMVTLIGLGILGSAAIIGTWGDLMVIAAILLLFTSMALVMQISQNRQLKLLLQNEQNLKILDRRKNEFLATIAHELRNPLAPILNSLSLLQNNNLDETKKERHCRIIERQMQRIMRLIDDLLDVGRSLNGQFSIHRQCVNLADVLSQASETCRPHIDKARHQLIVALPDELLSVNGDPDRLTQLFSNLIQNACKYTPNCGTIRLQAQRATNTVVVSIRDNGDGISAENLPKLFTIFTQVSDTNPAGKVGLGIGLSIVRNLVELHGGQVEARSDGLGHGSEFIVRLPMRIKTETSQDEEHPSADSESRSLHVHENLPTYYGHAASTLMVG